MTNHRPKNYWDYKPLYHIQATDYGLKGTSGFFAKNEPGSDNYSKDLFSKCIRQASTYIRLEEEGDRRYFTR